MKRHVVTHGTRNEYNNFGCRCEACTAANTEYEREKQYAPCIDCGGPVWGRFRENTRCRACYAATRVIALELRHGTETGYKKGCRCRPCRGASADARRRRRRAAA